jgi:glycosyltransferase involved in cell wall biosynthesis
MKLVFLHNDFKVYWRGRLYFLHDFFMKKNIQVHVIEIFGNESPYAFDQKAREDDWWDCLFETEQFSELTTSEVKQKIMNRLDEVNPDILIAGPIPFTSGAIGMQWAYKRRKKIIIFDDSKHSHYNRNFLVNFIKIYLIKLAYGILVPSEDYDSEYAKWNIAKTNLYYGLNCIDNDYFHSKRKEFFSNSKNIVCVGRLVKIKNLEALLNSWKSVEQLDAEYQLIIIGDGPENENLLDLKNKLGLARVKFLGNQNRRVIAKILAHSDAFILPSFLEGWALVVNEAMSACLPVLLSNRINAGHTLLLDGVNGYSFDPYQPEQITEAILNYIRLSEAEKIKMAKSAYFSVEKYNYAYLGNQLFKAIHDLKQKKTKRLSLLGFLLLSKWNGKFKTANWDTLK